MSQGNVEIVRESVQRFLLTGELFEDEVDPQFVIHDHALPGEFRGEDGFSDWLSSWAQALGDSMVEPSDYRDAGDKVVAVLDVSTPEGAPAGRHAMVWTFDRGSVVRVDYYGSADEALQAAGA